MEAWNLCSSSGDDMCGSSDGSISCNAASTRYMPQPHVTVKVTLESASHHHTAQAARRYQGTNVQSGV